MFDLLAFQKFTRHWGATYMVGDAIGAIYHVFIPFHQPISLGGWGPHFVHHSSSEWTFFGYENGIKTGQHACRMQNAEIVHFIICFKKLFKILSKAKS
jgi:hypothetical protein